MSTWRSALSRERTWAAFRASFISRSFSYLQPFALVIFVLADALCHTFQASGTTSVPFLLGTFTACSTSNQCNPQSCFICSVAAVFACAQATFWPFALLAHVLIRAEAGPNIQCNDTPATSFAGVAGMLLLVVGLLAALVLLRAWNAV